jgi:quinol monooxygenase YgiN
MIVFSLTVFVPPPQHSELMRSIGGLLEPTRVLPGCISCRFYKDNDDTDAFMLVQEWDTREALEQHLTSSAYRTLVAVIELSARAPTIHFDELAQRHGIELIEAARRAKGLL